MVMPVLLLLVFGIFEFGFAFRDYLGVANSTRDGAREATVAGNIRNADFRTVQAIRYASSALPRDTIEAIVIYKASGPESEVTDISNSCTTQSVAGACNFYSPDDFDLVAADFGCKPAYDPTPDPDLFWCPNTRNVALGTRDYVGVYMRVKHKFITGFFGNDITFEDSVVMRLEPQEL